MDIESLYIVTSYPMDEPVIRNRIEPYIDGALRCGYSVHLISPEAEVNVSPLRNEITHHTVPNVSRSSRSGFISRAYQEWRLSRRLLEKVPQADNVGVIITIPSMFLLFSSKPMLRGFQFLDVRDVTWEYLSDKKLSTFAAKRLFRKLAKRKTGFFHLIAVTNSTEYEYVSNELGVDAGKVIRVSNGISQAQFDRLEPFVTDSEPEKHPQPRVTYIGNVGLAQNLVTLLEAARELTEVHFDIVGEGTDFARIKGISKSWNLSNVHFFGRLPWEDIPAIYHKSDVLYAQLTPDFSGAMPSKLYEYLASGKYVIYGGEQQAVEILKNFDNYQVVPPEDSRALIAAIKSVAEMGEYRHISFDNRRRIEEQFIRERCVGDFFQKVAQ